MKQSINLIIAVLAVFIAIFSCDHKQQSVSHRNYADSLVDECFRTEDFDRLMALIDSFQQTGDYTPEWADFRRGEAYDMARSKQVTEHYWDKLYRATDPKKDPDFYYFVS